MSVYDLDVKGMRKTFLKFNKTTYGKTVFLLAYIITLFLFIQTPLKLTLPTLIILYKMYILHFINYPFTQ